MKGVILAAAVIVAAAITTGSAQPAGKTHRLEATPATVAYGYYDAAAKPVLKIASGDIIDVDTLLTNTPARLERAGVKAEDIQPSLRAIVDGVTDKGPGGHILTGPVYVEGLSRVMRSKCACCRSICRSPMATTAARDFCARTASSRAHAVAVHRQLRQLRQLRLLAADLPSTFGDALASGDSVYETDDDIELCLGGLGAVARASGWTRGRVG
jgi:hypothetical protein